MSPWGRRFWSCSFQKDLQTLGIQSYLLRRQLDPNLAPGPPVPYLRRYDWIPRERIGNDLGFVACHSLDLLVDILPSMVLKVSAHEIGPQNTSAGHAPLGVADRFGRTARTPPPRGGPVHSGSLVWIPTRSFSPQVGPPGTPVHRVASLENGRTHSKTTGQFSGSM